MRRRKGRLAKILSVPVLAVCGFAAAATLAGVGLATTTPTSTSPDPTTAPTTTQPEPTTTTTTTTTTTAPPGNEGCTPGFWKNNADKKGASQWGPTGFLPTQTVGSVFSAAPASVANLTLLQGLQEGGGDVDALTRHAIAAVLAAAHPDVDYPLTVLEIQNMVNAAFASGDAATIEALKDVLDGFNNAGCPISQNP
jgi:hypothetical protein